MYRYIIPPEIYIYPLRLNMQAYEYKYTNNEDLNSQFINENLSTQFIFHKTSPPPFGGWYFVTYNI